MSLNNPPVCDPSEIIRLQPPDRAILAAFILVVIPPEAINDLVFFAIFSISSEISSTFEINFTFLLRLGSPV